MSIEEKQRASAMQMLHRRRGRRFYDLLNEVNDSLTICFDMMENLVLPKTPVGRAYYSRQLYLYVFGVVRHLGRNLGQGRETIDLYVWREDQNKKDSNMISSALWHYFTNVLSDQLSDFNTLRLFSDSCYGQNKNINTLAMLFALKKKCLSHMDIKYFFPVRGHSFLPCDRAFGRIEREIKTHDIVSLPTEYIDMLKHHGRVRVYGEDWCSYDFKGEVRRHVKQARSFKLSEARVLSIDGDQLGLRPTYNGEFSHYPVLKKGGNWARFTPSALPTFNNVSMEKKNDVITLLAEMGAA